MKNRQANQYQEVEIKTSTPTELIVLLYDASITGLQEAQDCIRSGDIPNRVRCLNKVMAIITELQATLNFDEGGDIAKSLDRLYAYIKERVFQANLNQETAPLLEASKLMDGLREAWIEVAREERRADKAREEATPSAKSSLSLPPPAKTQAESLNITG